MGDSGTDGTGGLRVMDTGCGPLGSGPWSRAGGVTPDLPAQLRASGTGASR